MSNLKSPKCLNIQTKKKHLLVKSRVSNQSHQLLPTWRSCIYKELSKSHPPDIRKSIIPQLPSWDHQTQLGRSHSLVLGLVSSHQIVGQQKYIVYIMHNLFLYTKWYTLNITWMNILPISIMYMIVHDIFVSIHEITNKFWSIIHCQKHIHQLRGWLSLTKQPNHPTSNPSGIFLKHCNLCVLSKKRHLDRLRSHYEPQTLEAGKTQFKVNKWMNIRWC